MNKPPTRASKHLVEILTPVHVGTGNDLVHESDYILETGQLRVIDKNTLFNILVESEREDLKDLSAKMTQLSDLVRYAGKRDGYILKPTDGKTFRDTDGNLKKVQIREHIKDGFFQPYLPGSSIKGAIRTALLAKMIKERGLENLKKEKPPLLPTNRLSSAERASEKLSQHLFARKAFEEKEKEKQSPPQFDFLRALHVGDANFDKPLPEILKLVEVHHFNPIGKKQLTTYTEALIQETCGSFTLQWDKFLFEHEEANSMFESEKLSDIADFDKLREILNAHALQRLEEEITFFQSHRATSAIESCRDLLRRVKQEANAAYLQLGWGGGWCNKTGNWMDRETKAEMRKLYPKNFGSGENFPKTRRLIVKNGQPYFPLGWIKIYSATSVKSESKSYRWVEDTLQTIL
ncbi:MAG: type III-A CRISPR-associated RAMP protein Csm5 [Thiotrichaceae bacterium IS1]|nr:MAG: type III-A CRISPR-associated RAMP protein Csm5 [Thiotrichaceae bacterium IS1]